MALKQLGARLAEFRVAHGELAIERARLQQKRAEALAAVAAARARAAPAPDAPEAPSGEVFAAAAEGAGSGAVELLKRQLVVLRVDAKLAKLAVEFQKLVRHAFSAAPHIVPTNPSTPPPPSPPPHTHTPFPAPRAKPPAEEQDGSRGRAQGAAGGARGAG